MKKIKEFINDNYEYVVGAISILILIAIMVIIWVI